MDTEEYETIGKRVGRRLLIGVGVYAPAFIVIGVTLWGYDLLDKAFSFLIDPIEEASGYVLPRVISNLIVLAITLAILWATGRAVETRIGKWFHRRFDWLFERIHPLYKVVRESVKMLIESLGTNGLVSRVLLVKSDLAVGGQLYGLLSAECEEDYLSGETEFVHVFLPHCPIGNTGFMARVPLSSIEEPEEEISVTDFMTKYNLRLGAGLQDRVRILVRRWSQRSNGKSEA